MLKEMLIFSKDANLPLSSRSVVEIVETCSAEPEDATQVTIMTLPACDIQATGLIFHFPWQ